MTEKIKRFVGRDNVIFISGENLFLTLYFSYAIIKRNFLESFMEAGART